MIISLCAVNIISGTVNYLFAGSNIEISNQGNYFLYYVTAVSGIGFVCLLILTVNPQNGITYIGRNSIIYYFLHDIIYALPNVVVYNIFHINTENLGEPFVLALSVIYVTIACVMLYFISKFINRYCPFMLGKFCTQKNKRKVTE